MSAAQDNQPQPLPNYWPGTASPPYTPHLNPLDYAYVEPPAFNPLNDDYEAQKAAGSYPDKAEATLAVAYQLRALNQKLDRLTDNFIHFATVNVYDARATYPGVVYEVPRRD